VNALDVKKNISMLRVPHEITGVPTAVVRVTLHLFA